MRVNMEWNRETGREWLRSDQTSISQFRWSNRSEVPKRPVPREFNESAKLAFTAKISFIQLLFREFHRTFGLQFLNDYWIFEWVLLSQSVKGAQVFSCSVGPPGEVHCSTTLVILDSLYSHFNCVSVASSIQIFIMCIHYWFHSRVKYSRLTRLCVNRLIGYCC